MNIISIVLVILMVGFVSSIFVGFSVLAGKEISHFLRYGKFSVYSNKIDSSIFFFVLGMVFIWGFLVCGIGIRFNLFS